MQKSKKSAYSIKPRGGYSHSCCGSKTIEGKLYRRAFCTNDLTLSTRVLEVLQLAEQDQDHGWLVRDAGWNARVEEYEDRLGFGLGARKIRNAGAGTLLAEYAPRFRDRLRARLHDQKESPPVNYLTHLRALTEFLGDWSIERIANTQPEAVLPLIRGKLTRRPDGELVGAESTNGRMWILERLLADAVANGLLSKDVTWPFLDMTIKRRRLSSTSSKDIEWLSPSELFALDKVLASPEDDFERAYFPSIRVALRLGLRWAEVSAISRDGLHRIDENVVLINRATKRRHRKDEGGEARAIGPTKTANEWYSAVPPTARTILEEQRLRVGLTSPHLFPDPNSLSKPHPYEPWKDAYVVAFERSGIALRLRMKQLLFRHSFCYWLKSLRVPLGFVAQHLGHKDSRMVERTYGTNSTRIISGPVSKEDLASARAFYEVEPFKAVMMTYGAG